MHVATGSMQRNFVWEVDEGRMFARIRRVHRAELG